MLSDTAASLSSVREAAIDLPNDGAAIVSNLDDIATQLDALYVELGTLGLRQHCPEIASISQRLQMVRDAVQAVVPAVEAKPAEELKQP